MLIEFISPPSQKLQLPLPRQQEHKNCHANCRENCRVDNKKAEKPPDNSVQPGAVSRSRIGCTDDYDAQRHADERHDDTCETNSSYQRPAQATYGSDNQE
jgi:hypothetical protein